MGGAEREKTSSCFEVGVHHRVIEFVSLAHSTLVVCLLCSESCPCLSNDATAYRSPLAHPILPALSPVYPDRLSPDIFIFQLLRIADCKHIFSRL